MVFVWFVQRGATAFDPRVSLKLIAVFSDADAQVGGDALPPQQPPKSQRFCQARVMNQSVPIGDIYQVRGQRHAIAHGRGFLFQVWIRKKSLQHCLRLAEPPPSQAQSNKWQQQARAQK